MMTPYDKADKRESSREEIHIHISSRSYFFGGNLKEVWRYRDLVLLFTKRTFSIYYKQTVLGPAWIFLNPIISSLIYMVVFGRIAGISTSGIPQILFYLTGNALWTFFASCVTNNASTFTDNAGLFGKVYFPRLTVPISNMLSSAIQFCVQISLSVILLVLYVAKGEVHPNWQAWFLIPLALLQLGMLGLGFGIIVSSLTTKYRDLTILVKFGVQLWMYITPVVYPLSTLHDGRIRNLVLLNPATASTEMFRYAFLGQGFVSMSWGIVSWVITAAITILGIMLFNRVEKTFMDTV